MPALEHEADNEAEEDSEERDSDGGGVRGRRDGIEADGGVEASSGVVADGSGTHRESKTE